MVVSGSNKSFMCIREENVFQLKTKTNSTLPSSQQASACGTNYGESDAEQILVIPDHLSE